MAYQGPAMKSTYSPRKSRTGGLGENQYLSRASYVHEAFTTLSTTFKFYKGEEIQHDAQGAELEFDSKSSDSKVFTLSITLDCLSE